jgi:hypothetical protein
MFDELTFEWLTIILGARSIEQKASLLNGLRDEEWANVFRLATQYGVASLFYDQVKRLAGTLTVSHAVMQGARGAYLANVARNLQITHELGLIIPALCDAVIPVIALKGAYLAENVYRDRGLRSIGSDVDLLVRSADFPRACVALSAVGYHPREADKIQADWGTKKNITLKGPPGTTPIELHWTIEHPTDAVKVDLDGLWARARSASVAGRQVLALAPEDLLLHLCLESTYHHGNWFQMALRPFCDLAAISQFAGKEMDWEEVALRARLWRAEHLVHPALWLARKWLAAPVPEGLLLSLKPEGLDIKLEFEAKKLVFFQSLVPASHAAMSWNVAQLGGPKSIKEKVKIVFKAAFPPCNKIAAIYGVPARSLRAWVYYIAHTMTLAWRNAPTAWGLLFRKKATAAHAHGINSLIQLKETMDSKFSPAPRCPEGG